MRILARYKITYNGGLIEYRNLVSVKDYNTIIKPLKIRIEDLEDNKELDAAQAIKTQLNNMFGELWFTTLSPLFKASLTNILILPENQGGANFCKVEKVFQCCATE